MGFFSRVENRMEDAVEGAADRMASAPISPVQIAKQCEKQMKRNKMVGAGKQIAPTLYTVLVNEDDDQRLFGYYPTLAGETETYLLARANDIGLSLDGKPLVRFIADPALKHGKFDVIAECVASPIVARLRDEEMARYGFQPQAARDPHGAGQRANMRRAPQPYEADPYDTYDEQGEYDNGYNDDYDNNYSSGYDNYDNNANAQNQDAGDFAGFDASGNMTGAGVAVSANTPGAAAGTAAGAVGAAAAGAAAAGTSHPRMNLPQAQPLRATLTDRATGQAFTLSASNIKLGRETDNDIVIRDMGASRYHATITRGQDCWILTDLNSTNGTEVQNRSGHTVLDGNAAKSVALRSGDIITIGETKYIFAQA